MDTISGENPRNPRSPAAGESSAPPSSPRPPRAAFTSLAQVDADLALALARLIQQQERAFLALQNGGGDFENYESLDDWSYGEEEEEEVGEEIEDSRGVLDEEADDEGSVVGIEHGDDWGGVAGSDYGDEGRSIVGSDYGDDEFDAVDIQEFEDDEVFARALMRDEMRGLVTHMMAMFGALRDGAGNLRRAGVNSQVSGSNSQNAWQDIDPDNYTYEELLAIGELVGSESRGLAADTVAALPVVNYKAENIEDGNADRCVICQLEYEEGNTLVVLSCKHSYHPDCINQWLQMNKVCPVCNTEVPTSEDDKFKD